MMMMREREKKRPFLHGKLRNLLNLLLFLSQDVFIDAIQDLNYFQKLNTPQDELDKYN